MHLTLWRDSRSQIKCGELVRRRLHALLMQGGSFDFETADPWEHYRTAGALTPSERAAAEGTPELPIASLPFEWMPETLPNRDCSCVPLPSPRADTRN